MRSIYWGLPGDEAVERFLASQRDAPLSYAPGITKEPLAAGYTVDRNGVELGRGPEVFARARAALEAWRMFRLGWLRVCPESSPLEEGRTVCVAARAFGLTFLNACRVVYLIEETGAVERCGFAYGTLEAHAEQGEELFVVEWDHADDVVRYRILALSRPRRWFARLGYPFTRALQRRFARDSLRALAEAVRGG